MKSSKTLLITALAVAGTFGAAAPASAHTASAPLTKARATSIAKSINLSAADFPGYTVTPYQESAAEKAEDRKLAACVGEEPEFVDVSSAEFDNSQGYGFSSETSFVSSVAAVKTDAKHATTAHARGCFKQELASAAAQAGAPNPTVTITPLKEARVSGLDATFGFKFAVSFTVVGQTAHLYGFDFGFGRGNAEVSLTEIGTANVPQSDSVSPLATLISRADKAVPASGLKVS